MSSGIYLVGHGKVNQGRVKAAEENLSNVIENVRTGNPGIEMYEHAIDSDTGRWTGIEKYANSEALKAHLVNPAVGEALMAFMSDLQIDGITVMGDVSQEVKQMMVAFNPSYIGPSLGFSRPGGRVIAGRA